MVQILEDEPNFATQLMRSNASTGPAIANAFMGEYIQGQQEKKREQAIQRLTGMNVRGLPPEFQQELVKQFSKTAAQKQLLQEAFPDKFSSKSETSKQTAGEQLQGKDIEGLEEKNQNQEGFNLANLNSEERTKLAFINPSLGKQATEEKKIKFKEDVHEQGLIDKSYEVHKPYIDDVTNSYKGFETEMKPRLMQMQALDDEKLIGPTAAKFLETMGVPLGALDDPSSEVFQKLSQDLLKGLPETYGNRILKVEVDNFLKTIPTLMNSPDGRRMIASNMLKLGQMKEAFYKEMRRQQTSYLEENKKFPKDFEQRVFDNVLPHINKLSNQFVKMSEVRSIPANTVPFFNPQGGISFVPNTKEDIQWYTDHNGERIW